MYEENLAQMFAIIAIGQLVSMPSISGIAFSGFNLFHVNMSLLYMLFTFAFAVAVVVDQSTRGYCISIGRGWKKCEAERP